MPLETMKLTSMVFVSLSNVSTHPISSWHSRPTGGQLRTWPASSVPPGIICNVYGVRGSLRNMMAVATRNTHPSSISLEFEELLKGEHRHMRRRGKESDQHHEASHPLSKPPSALTRHRHPRHGQHTKFVLQGEEGFQAPSAGEKP